MDLLNNFITVFTPTYNRSHTLHRVYYSLIAQTNKNFEWLIVDDGSSDNTKSLVEEWQSKKNGFEITYMFKQNGGKHTAINDGVSHAKGEFFLIADSDDLFEQNTIKIFLDEWDKVRKWDNRNEIGGIWCLCKNQKGELVGQPYPESLIIMDYKQYCFKLRMRSENWHIERTDAMKEFPFPTTHIPYYVPEGIVWSRLYSKYKMYCINEPLRTYIQESDGLMQSQLSIKNFFTEKLYLVWLINERLPDFRHDPLFFIAHCYRYIFLSLYFNHSPWRIFNDMNFKKGQIIYFLTLIFYPFIRCLVILKKMSLHKD